MTLDELRDAAAAAINTSVPGVFKTAKGFDGPASLGELLRRSQSLPALLVNTPEDRVIGKYGKTPRVEIDFEAYVVVKTTVGDGNDRGRLVLRAAEAVRNAVVPLVLADSKGATTGIRRRSLYSQASDEQGVAVQVVTWTQEFAQTPDPSALQPFTLLHAEITVSPDPGDDPDTTDDIPIPPE